VRKICNHLSRPLAYTTVMTTLDRLYKKDLLQREKEGRGYRYSCRTSGQNDQGRKATNHFGRSNSASSVPLISYLLDSVETYDEELLQELEKKIAARREQFERGEKL
jgi:predicted transcriptional regulator